MTATYDAGLSIEQLFPDNTINEHVMETDMWAGSHSIIDLPEYTATVFPETINSSLETISYNPSLYKCFDEAVVNGLDNLIRNLGTAGDNAVTKIDVEYLPSGRIIVTNNGRGVPIGWHSVAKLWSVEMIFRVMFKGRAKNDREKKVTGDANRVGIKLANILSDEFTVETVCERDGKRTKYFQRFYKNNTACDEPIITENVSSAQYTKVSFMPSYAAIFKQDITNLHTYTQLCKLFCFRTYTAAAYAGFYSGGKCSVTFNGVKLSVACMSDIAQLMFGVTPAIIEPIKQTRGRAKKQPQVSADTITDNIVKVTTTTTDGNVVWEICVVIADNANASSKKSLAAITNINGVCVKAGRHITHVLDMITAGAKDAVMKKLKTIDIKFQPSYIYNNIFILINAQIPGVGWTGQRKDEAVCAANKVSGMIPDPAFIKKISEALSDRILAQVCTSSVVGTVDTKTNSDLSKYTPAGKCKKEPQKCSLLLPEGDSAASTVKTGITTKGPNGKEYLGWDYYGMLTLGGVIVNVRKDITVNIVDGKRIITLGKMLQKNTFFNTLIDVVGLDLTMSYNPDSPNYAKEIATLRYGAIIACVDQDHDGTGFIFPLICNLFAIFWPHLLAAGFVKKWDTPQRIAIHKRKNTVTEFFTDDDFKQWQQLDTSHNDTNYHIEYFKGLAGHDDEAITHMFSRFLTNVFTFLPDENTEPSLEMMFGHCTNARKLWLQTPIVMPTATELAQRRQLHKSSVTTLVHCEGKEHHLSNLVQKLPSAIDGMNESGRKILNGSIKAFSVYTERPDKDKMRLNVLMGHIFATEHYQHGDGSLLDSICGKALICVGGVQLPQLLPCSMFGTRRLGGDGDAGQARYIYAKINQRLVSKIYNPADYEVLEFIESDGEIAEPKYFVPVLPMQILEHIHMPATGWKIKVWARDALGVINTIKYLINTYTSTADILTKPIPQQQPHTRGFVGEFREIRGTLACFGNYIYDEQTRVCTITEIPIGSWTEKFARSLDKKATFTLNSGIVIKMFDGLAVDRSGTDSVRIEVTIAERDKATGIDPVDIINQFADGFTDGFEKYFNIYEYVDDQLNMIAVNGSVIEFKNYEDSLRYWFIERVRVYELRITRQRILLELEIDINKQILTYITSGTNIKDLSEPEAIELFKQNNYKMFAKSMLSGKHKGRFINTNSLVEMITQPPHASYDYLIATSDRDRLAPSIARLRILIAKLEAELHALNKSSTGGTFVGSAAFIDELGQIEQVIKDGYATNWKFGDTKVYT